MSQVMPYVAPQVPALTSNALSALQKAEIARYIYEEGKGLARGMSKTLRNRRRRQRKNAIKRANMRLARAETRSLRLKTPSIDSTSYSLDKLPETAPNAVGTMIKQAYHSSLRQFTVSHSELVGDINGSTSFSLNKFRINAGNAIVFAWLSAVAPNFECYYFRKLKFYLKPQCATTTNGSLMMAMDYDPADADPLDKRSLMSYEDATRCAPWQNAEMNCRAEDLARLPKYFVSQSNPGADADKRLADLANLYVATAGQADSSAVSELWVDYEVVLMTPQYQVCNVGALVAATGGTSTVPSVTNYSGDLGHVNGASFVIDIPGRYLITADCALTTPEVPDNASFFHIYLNGGAAASSISNYYRLNSSDSTANVSATYVLDLADQDVITWAASIVSSSAISSYSIKFYSVSTGWNVST
jgi:hypothetical protein